MMAHLIDTHLVPRSRSSAKVKVKYQGHVSQKMGVSGALVFHKHILFLLRAYIEIKQQKPGVGTGIRCSCLTVRPLCIHEVPSPLLHQEKDIQNFQVFDQYLKKIVIYFL